MTSCPSSSPQLTASNQPLHSIRPHFSGAWTPSPNLELRIPIWTKPTCSFLPKSLPASHHRRETPRNLPFQKDKFNTPKKIRTPSGDIQPSILQGTSFWWVLLFKGSHRKTTHVPFEHPDIFLPCPERIKGEQPLDLDTWELQKGVSFEQVSC